MTCCSRISGNIHLECKPCRGRGSLKRLQGEEDKGIRVSYTIKMSFKAEGEEKNIHFQLGSLPNPYASAQLSVLRDALIFRKEVDVLVEDTKKKSLILGVSLSQKTHD